MKKTELLKIVKMWSPIIDELNKESEINVEKLTKDEKMCLYAHYHSKLESTCVDTCNSLHILPSSNIKMTDDQILNNSTLPISLKILKNVNNFKNISIVNSPITELDGVTVRVGNIEHSKDISDLLIEDELSLTVLSEIEDVLISSMNEFFEKLLSENPDKKIFLYIVIQSILIMKNEKKLLWGTRLAVI